MTLRRASLIRPPRLSHFRASNGLCLALSAVSRSGRARSFSVSRLALLTTRRRRPSRCSRPAARSGRGLGSAHFAPRLPTKGFCLSHSIRRKGRGLSIYLG